MSHILFVNDTTQGEESIRLVRRGFELGVVQQTERPQMPDADDVLRHWQRDEAVLLPGMLDLQSRQPEIKQAQALME
ncbi:MAG: hypothetical protein ACE5E3_05570, partial [Mariprofundus sp.]